MAADPQQTAVDFYVNRLGLTREQASGAARWMRKVESGLDPSAYNPAGGGHGALGIGQWRGPRQDALLASPGADTLQGQLEFSAKELLGPERKALDAIRSAQTEDQAYRAWGKYYERPGPGVLPPEGSYGGAYHLNVPAPPRAAPPAGEGAPGGSGIEAPQEGAPGDALGAFLTEILRPPKQQEAAADPLAGFLSDILGRPAAVPPAAAPPQSAPMPPVRPPVLPAPVSAAQPVQAGGQMQPAGGGMPAMMTLPGSAAAPPVTAGGDPLASFLGNILGTKPAAAATLPPEPAQPAAPQSGFDPLKNFLTEILPSPAREAVEVGKFIGEGGIGAKLGMPSAMEQFETAQQPIKDEAGNYKLPAHIPMEGPGPWLMSPGTIGKGGGGRALPPPRQEPPAPQVPAVPGRAIVPSAGGGSPPSAPPPAIPPPAGPGRPGTPPVGGAPTVTTAPARYGPALSIDPTPGLLDIGKSAARTMRAWFAPPSMGPAGRAAEASIRQSLGRAARTEAVSQQAFEQYRPLTAPLVRDFQDYVGQMQAHLGGKAPYPAGHPDALSLADYIEGRGAGATLPPHMRHMQGLADELRQQMKQREAAIAADPYTTDEVLVDDYLSHAWKNQKQAAVFLHGTRPRQGSGGSLKHRTWATLAEGIERGGIPASFDPIEMSMRYIANMDRYLASNEIFHTGRDSGMIRYYGGHLGPPPEGWAPLEGRMAEKIVAFEHEGDPRASRIHAYAPEDYARIYNRSSHVDPGWAGAPLYQGLRMVANATTQTLLSLSGYHYMAMLQEALTSRLGNALGQLTDGELTQTMRTLGSTLDAAAIGQLRKGTKLQHSYLRVAENGPLYERIADDLTSARGRIIGRGQEWRGSAADNYFTAWRRGALGTELRTGLREVAGGPLSTAPFRAGQMFFREVGRIAHTMQAPLFDVIVPKLKAGAFFDEMSSWLEAHPTAGRTEEIAFATKVWDSIDDRFGEMVMDNIFWDQRFKQGLQLLMVSPGWELGSLRGQAGGLLDAASGKWTPRARWLVGLTLAIPMADSVYQQLKTGTNPLASPSPFRDIVAPRTGGQTPEGQPERAILPGYEKDPLGWGNDPVSKLFGMANPATKLAYEMATGKDSFTGRPIVQKRPEAPSWIKQWASHIATAVEPIFLQQMQKRLPGTNISTPEAAMGIRPAPGWITDPQRTRAMKEMHDLGEAERAAWSDYAAAKRVGDVEKMQKFRREAIEIRRQRKIERTQMPPSGTVTGATPARP